MNSSTGFKSSNQVWESVDSLGEIIAAKFVEPADYMKAALNFILEKCNKDYGLISIWGGDGGDGRCFCEYKVPEEWQDALKNQKSTLYRLVNEESNSQRVRSLNRAGLGEIIFVPIVHNTIQYGTLLIGGEIKGALERSFYSRTAGLIARSIVMWLQTYGFADRSEQMDLQLLKIISMLDSKLELSEVQLQIGNALQKVFECAVVVMAFVDVEHEGMLLKKTLSDREKGWNYQVSLKSGKGIIGHCIQTGEVVLTNEPSRHALFDEEVDGIPDKEVGSVLCVPMKVEGQMIGAVELIRYSGEQFSERDQKSLYSILVAVSAVLYGVQLTNQQRVLTAELEANSWELAKSRNILRSLFDNLPHSVYIIDREYRLLAVNATRAKRALKDPKDITGHICYGVLFNHSEPCPGCLVTDTLYGGRFTNRKERYRDAAGEFYEWEINSYPIVNDEGEISHAILIEQDVTEKRRLESILAQSEKLSAIGQLAAGLAHEINNPLTVIMANAQLMQRELGGNEDWTEALDLIMRAGSRALQVVRNLLGLARKEEYSMVSLDVNENIQLSLDLVRHEAAARSVEIVFKPQLDLPTVKASGDHLQGVWLNILLNALDSIGIKSDGMICISTFVKDEEVYITISDNGRGIAPEKLKRIFEPFYTTKEPVGDTGGVGLGLSVCHQLVKQHGGDIFVESEEGKGTVFTIVLPVFSQSDG